jgi:hypothetical protein
LPAVESERVGLAEDDATLMWKVFDYASMSASKSTGVSSTVGKRTDNSEDGLPPREHQPDVSQNAITSQQSEVPISYGNPLNAGFNSMQVPPVEETLDVPNPALFDQLPEDWAFTIDDWTLFGAPGSTYFYNDGT